MTEIDWGAYGSIAMKTTLNLDDRLLRSAKKAAAERGVTLTSVIEDALRTSLPQPPARERYKFEWKAEGGGFAPGVKSEDFNSRERLYDIMDGFG